MAVTSLPSTKAVRYATVGGARPARRVAPQTMRAVATPVAKRPAAISPTAAFLNLAPRKRTIAAIAPPKLTPPPLPTTQPSATASPLKPSDTWHIPWPNFSWIFNRDGAAAPSYEELEARLRAAAHSPHLHDRREFLDWFSRAASPRLPTEEAALQLLCKFSYLYLEPGNHIDLHISRNIEGEAEHTYAHRYHLNEVAVDRKLGLVGYFLEPGMFDTYKDHKNAIIVFRGTSMGPNRDIMTSGFPTGLKPDVDHRGIGLEVFNANREQLQGWVRKCINRGQRVTLTGHSLGGVVAARLLASLTPEEQAFCRILTYNTPGLDVPTQQKIVPRPGEIREIRNKADPVARAGERHLPGIAYEYLVWDHFHVMSWLAQRELDSMPLDLERRRESYWGDTIAFIEIGRRLFGMVAYDHVPA